MPCFVCKKRQEKIVLLRCGHTICKKCMKRHLVSTYGRADNSCYFVLKCPLAHCSYLITEDEVKVTKFYLQYRKPEEAGKQPPAVKYCVVCQSRDEKLFCKDGRRCGHLLCERCARSYAERATNGDVIRFYDLKNGKCAGLPCPMQGCKERIGAEDLLGLYKDDQGYVETLKKNARERFVEEMGSEEVINQELKQVEEKCKSICLHV